VTAREKEVLGEAMLLTVKQRARLAAELLASIEGEPDRDAESAWAVEIERRAKRALAGKSAGTDWATVRARIQKSARR
jgi:putative addiction module component (TIGR02574 family)